MARASNCDSCGRMVSHLFAVQYRNGGYHHNICPLCYDHGVRVNVSIDGSLYVAPTGQRARPPYEAIPYYFNAVFLADPPTEYTYPSVYQPGFGPEGELDATP